MTPAIPSWVRKNTAVLLGGARLYLPGEAGRTWWGVWLAMGASAWLVLAWAPEAFPLAFLVITATLHLLANLATDARVRREPHLPPGQRRRQRALVWALPVVGVLVVSAWYRADDDPWDDDGFQTHDDT